MIKQRTSSWHYQYIFISKRPMGGWPFMLWDIDIPSVYEICEDVMDLPLANIGVHSNLLDCHFNTELNNDPLDSFRNRSSGGIMLVSCRWSLLLHCLILVASSVYKMAMYTHSVGCLSWCMAQKVLKTSMNLQYVLETVCINFQGPWSTTANLCNILSLGVSKWEW